MKSVTIDHSAGCDENDSVDEWRLSDRQVFV